MNFELVAFAICMSLGVGLEILLRVLVGEWWWLWWLALVTAAHVLVMVAPDRYFAWLVGRYPWLRSSEPAAPVLPVIARVEAERRALERLLKPSPQPATLNVTGTLH